MVFFAPGYFKELVFLNADLGPRSRKLQTCLFCVVPCFWEGVPSKVTKKEGVPCPPCTALGVLVQANWIQAAGIVVFPGQSMLHMLAILSGPRGQAHEFVHKRPECQPLETDLLIMRVAMEYVMKQADLDLCILPRDVRTENLFAN